MEKEVFLVHPPSIHPSIHPNPIVAVGSVRPENLEVPFASLPTL
jgi:hypothetical protein